MISYVTFFDVRFSERVCESVCVGVCVCVSCGMNNQAQARIRSNLFVCVLCLVEQAKENQKTKQKKNRRTKIAKPPKSKRRKRNYVQNLTFGQITFAKAMVSYGGFVSNDTKHLFDQTMMVM